MTKYFKKRFDVDTKELLKVISNAESIAESAKKINADRVAKGEPPKYSTSETNLFTYVNLILHNRKKRCKDEKSKCYQNV
jgi:hypothetical protein